jgi:YVTN family beta-propeller protein
MNFRRLPAFPLCLFLAAPALSSASTKYVYAAELNNSLVAVINQSTNKVVDFIKVSTPYGIAVDSHTSELYVTNWTRATVTVISTANNRVL